MKKVLMLFIDGVGFGKPDKNINPFFNNKFDKFISHFESIPSLDNQEIENENFSLFPVDANMEVEGLPQSGTGQTAIFCGINSSKIVGKHFGPFPYSTLIPIIKEKNIFKELKDAGKKSYFANAYPNRFFEYLESGRTRLSVTTLSYSSAGFEFNTVDELVKGEALTGEITNERWVKNLNYYIPIITPEQAAQNLINISKKNDFTLFEYYYTDHIGHLRHKDEADNFLSTLDSFLCEVLRLTIEEGINLIICSDHGNIEDLSVKMHTLNPSICVLSGELKNYKNKINSLPDIKPTILKYIFDTI